MLVVMLDSDGMVQDLEENRISEIIFAVLLEL